jgi:predicted amino acid racemase
MRTLTEAVRILGGAEQVNAPGHTSLAVLPLLRDAGATHGEPGHALTGTTPLAAQRDVGEEPAICYLSEVSHRDGDRLSVFGSGFYARGHCRGGLLVHGDDRRLLAIDPLPADAIDYYRHLRSDGGPAAVGDAVVFAFRFQAFTSRALVATVEGLSAGTPRLAGIHDSNGRPAATPRLA